MRDAHDRRAEDLLGEWHERRRTGQETSAAAWIEAHPDVADELRLGIDALERLEELRGAEASDAPALPHRIGEYRVLREIGRGGMGVVYEAEQPEMHRRVALKVLYPSITNTAEAVERFKREARAPARITHTNVVTVHHLGEDRGTWYCAMELVEGHSLDLVLDGLRRTRGTTRGTADDASSDAAESWRSTTGEERYFRRVAQLFAEVAEGLQQAHDEGIVHRDLKPANLILSTRGLIKILDFGLARVRGESPGLTVTGGVVGTPSYMSPEQAGSRAVDPRTDVYSLGATLYEVLTLRTPFRAKDMAGVLQRIRNEEPPSLRRLDARVPRDLETIVLKAMEKDPARRYVRADAMAQDLRRFAVDAAIRARRVGWVERAWRAARRRKALTAMAAAVLVLASVAVALAARVARESEQHRVASYERLCVRAEQAFAANAVGSLDCDVRTSESSPVERLLSEAIALVPGRPEAYLGRAFAPRTESVEARLADLDAARARGLGERTYRLARARMLRVVANREEEATEEERLAADAAPSATPLDAYFEGRYLVVSGRGKEGAERLDQALRDAPEGSLVRTMARFARALARELAGDVEGAIDDLSSLRGGGGEAGPGPRVRMAQLWGSLGRTDRAKAILEEVLADTRRAATREGWGALCRAAINTRSQAFSEAATAEAVVAFPTAPELLASRAVALLNAGRSGDALPLARALADAQPSRTGTHLLMGDVLLGQGRTDAAAAEFRKALTLDARSSAAHIGLARALARKGNGVEELAELRAAADCEPMSHMAHHLLTAALLKRGNGAHALITADRALALDPWCAGGRVSRAQALRMLGRDAGATLVEYGRIAALDPDCHEAHHQRALLLDSLGRREDALPAFEEAVRTQPSCGGAARGLAEAWMGRGDAVRAEAELRRVLSLAPDDPETIRGLGQVLAEVGRPEAAMEQYDRAILLEPKGIDARYARANLLLKLGRANDAIVGYDEVLAIDPRAARALVNKGNALDGLRQGDDAFHAYVSAEKIDPTLYEAPNGQANVLRKAGKHAEALLAAERAVALHPRSASPWMNQGLCLLNLGQPALALAAFEIAVLKAPRLAWARLDRGYALRDLNRMEEALAAFRLAAEMDPSILDAHLEIGATLQRLGRHAEARQPFERAVALDPKSARARRMLAGLLSDLGVLGSALEHIDEAVHLDATDVDAHRTRARILYKLRRSPAAIDEARLVVAADGATARDHLYLGVLLAEAGPLDEAARAFHVAQTLAPTWPDPYSMEAGMWRDAGRREEALAVWGRLLAIDPKSAVAHSERARLLLDLGQGAQAVRELDEAIALESSVAAHHLNRGEILLAMLHDWRRALPSLERSVALDEKAASARHSYGVALWCAGRTDDALRELERAIELDPLDLFGRVDRWNVLTAVGRHADALTAAEADRKQLPDVPYLARLQVISLRLLGRAEAARAFAAERLGKDPAAADVLDFAYLCAIAKRPQEAQTWLARGDGLKAPGEAFDRARVFAALGDREKALHWIEAAAEQGYFRPAKHPPEPDFEFLQRNPRFVAAMGKIVLP